MIEIPESNTLANQLNEIIKGKKILSVITNNYHHKFAFFYNDPKEYNNLLKGRFIGNIFAYGGQIKISTIDDSNFDGNKEIPEKHQLLIKFEDSSAIICSARMYAQLHVALENDYENDYFDIAMEKPSPLSENFDMDYFKGLLSEVRANSSVKSFLATKQRITGLGNGSLQDILFNARINPKTKIKRLSKEDKKRLFNSVKRTLYEMTKNGGRSTEKTLFGDYGGYEVILSSKTYKIPCPSCGDKIVKESYLGGTIYYCPTCQKTNSS